MRLALLIALTMLAFAANSLLTRAGVAAGTDPMRFALIRVLSGAVVLSALAWRARGTVPLRPDQGAVYLILSVLGLAVYLIGFSAAYLTLDAGVGALVLFATVQAGLFGGALVTGAAVGARRWMGMGIALVALGWLLWPGVGGNIPLGGALAMVAAGLGWALYTWQGRGARWALGASAANFVWAGLVLLLVTVPMGGEVTATGVVWAVLSGAVASGLGYALWFHVLPSLSAPVAGLVQLSVPVIALLAGAVLLEEALTGPILLACAAVLGGIALGLLPAQPKSGSNGS